MSITAPHGQVTTLGLDANGYLESVTTPKCETTQLLHTSTGLLTKLTEPIATNIHTFQYDASGLLTNDKTPPASPGLSLSRMTPGNGWNVTLSTEQSRTTSYSIDTTPDSMNPTQIELRTTTARRSEDDGGQIRRWFQAHLSSGFDENEHRLCGGSALWVWCSVRESIHPANGIVDALG